jgi:hypothetical protein
MRRVFLGSLGLLFALGLVVGCADDRPTQPATNIKMSTPKTKMGVPGGGKGAGTVTD